ncbi:putative GPI-anchored protein pfl2 [Rhagoletis pomonella]|uniref:putative GPI-anchored protein pfl2 n=1 Tax=Rhagoletis pomonella TaxID=28610 RepID=UPI00178418E9|nr:putative GPI-anchored protein pfl2 [Rhagoletis pomonella]XP_036329373.1 putative GPI-anchored protein pfl2 [Rhagoletis pomonella]XP_036329374.1 putative GPI-anchored protein pfl2 [Rhagoletis pomonella]
MLSERSLLFAFGGGFNSVDKQSSSIGFDLATTTPSPVLAATAAAYICLEKAKKKKLPAQATEADVTTTVSTDETQLDSLDNNVIMESSKNNNNSNRKTNINSHANTSNNIANTLMNSLSGSSGSLITNPNMTNNHPYQQQTLHPNAQQHQPAQKQPQKNISSTNIGNVKREEVSPGPCTNGDLQSSVVRSRSTTPSSFRGPSPQQISSEALIPLSSLLRIQATSVERHNSNVIGPNMDTINVNATAHPPEFTTRNYSDIMRSLAAKYNDSSPTNSSSTRRNTYFEASASTPPAPVINKTINQQTGNSKSAVVVALPNAMPKEDTQPQLLPRLSMSPGEVAVAAAAASFLSNLPFSQSVCPPPLIDMSSTQALVTLARAAKEAEIQAILRCPQQNVKSINSTSILPHPNLAVALQQAAQFVSPALMYSAQLQQQRGTQSARLPSPLQKLNNISTTNSTSDPASKNKTTGATNAVTVPLDLSSQPPAAKRFKVELNTVGSSIESDDLKISIGSPPPLTIAEKNLLFRSSNAIQRRLGSHTPEQLSDVGLSGSPALATQKPSVTTPQCRAHSEEVAQWTVEDVCAFVGEIDICADYVKHFRDQCIDGSGLPLLTEDHLLNALGMKLGPALKLRSLLAKKLGGPCPCVACLTQARQVLALQTATKTDAASPRGTTSAAAESSTESGSTTGISDTNHKEKQTQEEKRQEGPTQQQQHVKEQRQANFCSNNDSSSSCAALTLQICANIYKSDANSNNPIEKKTNNENETSGPRIPNKVTGGNTDTDTDIEPIENKDCKSSSRCVGNSNTNNGSLQRTGSGDIPDVGS